MKRVVFSGRFPDAMAHPLQRRLRAVPEVSQAELLMWGPMGTVTTLTWFDGGTDAVSELLAAVESVAATELLEHTDGTYAFVHQTEYEFEESILDLVPGAKIVFLPPITFREEGTVQFEAVGQPDSLTAFYTELTALIDAGIERVHDFERRTSSTRMTDRQAAALEAAVAVGYYDVPRSGAVEDVGDELECASSTAGELLRKAESELVTTFVDSR